MKFRTRMWRPTPAAIFMAFLLAAQADASPWATKEDAATVIKEMKAILAGAGTRCPGSPGNLALEEKIAGLFSTSGFKHGEITFRAPTFLPGATTLSVPGHTPIRMLPMHPTLFRPGNFTNGTFTADLIYLGKGTTDDIAAVDGLKLDCAIAVMEFDCGSDWLRFLRFGIKGFVFIGATNEYRYCDSAGKVYLTEVSAPRFFINPGDGSFLRQALLANNRRIAANIESAPSRWENRALRDLWVLIPGADKDMENEVVVFVAPLDADCVAPELAAGAQSAANLCLLIRLFEEHRNNPPARSILLAAVNAHTQNFLGERALAWYLLAQSAALEELQDTLAADLRLQEMLAEKYGRLNLNPPTKDDEDYLIALRTMSDGSTGKHITIKEPVVALAKRNVNLLKAKQLALARRGLSAEKLRDGIDELTAQRAGYVNVLTLFNKVGIRTKLSDLSADEVEILRGYIRETLEQNKTWAEINGSDIAANTANTRIREALSGRDVKFVITLEFTWTGRRVGFCSGNFWGAERWSLGWGANVARIAADLTPPSLSGGNENIHVVAADKVSTPRETVTFTDAMTKRGGLPESHFFPIRSPAVNYFHAADGTPAFAAGNVYSDSGRAFSPDDTLENLDADIAAEIMNYMSALFRAMLRDRNVTSPSVLDKPKPLYPSWSVVVKSFKFDEFSASVLPELPLPNSAIILSPPPDLGETIPPPLVAGDVINSFIALTDARASCVFFGLKDANLSSGAFHFDRDFIAVDHAIDAGENETKAGSAVNRDARHKVLALFECREFPILARHDPSAISVSPIDVKAYIPLSGRLDSAPKKYGVTGVKSALSQKSAWQTEGPVAFFVEPDEPLKLLTDKKALLLNASERFPHGIGFNSSDEMGADFYGAAVKDMSRLNHERLKKLRGVSDELAGDFLRQGDRAMEEMSAAWEANRHLNYLQSLYKALGAHAKAYAQTSGITNDMLKAVVFYMALMLPFCFFVEKLVFKFVKIEAEIAMFAALFVLTFVLFRAIHPAFRIAEAPEAIFVAFVMGGLGAFVIKILHDRFEGEMQLLFKTGPGMGAEGAGYSTVGQEAMLIGVNNMKRRRIRTTLTTATVVLVTFTMLAFTSISKRLSPTVIAVSDTPPYTGLMYHWPGNSRMDEATMQALEEIFAGQADIVVRRWLLPRTFGDAIAPFHAAASSGQTAIIDAVLGLSAAENGFLAGMPMLAGRFFDDDDADEVILTSALAKALGIAPTDAPAHTLRFQNHEFGIAGILRDDEFRAIKDINQRPLLPIKSVLKQAAGDETVAAGDMEAKAPEETGVFFVDPSALLILPVKTARRFGAQPYSVSARLKRDLPVWPFVERLLTITSASKFFMSSATPFAVGEGNKSAGAPGVYYIGESYRTSIGGLSFLIIPLLISATIILNTMLGSVFERKSEIAVYNAVGLNPTHIGMFFLAESFVYSVIGSVGGYLIGQMLSIMLTETGLIGDINLNFSSLAVVYVILFTVAVVLLSTIYPSIVATRAAVPSGKRKWSLPDNDGNTMRAVFPFIYQPDLIMGLLGYLEEYFSRYTEASFGDLTAAIENKSRGKDEQGRDTYRLAYHVALAPFDLGVTQRVAFSVAFDDRVQAYRVSMDIARVSGQDTNWTTTNGPFLEKLRAYLLRWRNMTAAEHALFVQRGRQLFMNQPLTIGVPHGATEPG